jgi:hypothetical protein
MTASGSTCLSAHAKSCPLGRRLSIRLVFFVLSFLVTTVSGIPSWASGVCNMRINRHVMEDFRDILENRGFKLIAVDPPSSTSFLGVDLQSWNGGNVFKALETSIEEGEYLIHMNLTGFEVWKRSNTNLSLVVTSRRLEYLHTTELVRQALFQILPHCLDLEYPFNVASSSLGSSTSGPR